MEPEKREEAGNRVEASGEGEELLNQYWSQHRITLIAYEVQYIYEQRPIEDAGVEEVEDEDEASDKKKPKKKINLKFESGFLAVADEPSDDVLVMNLAKDYESLNWLFNCQQLNENCVALRDFIKILLELKHSALVREFCHIYNIGVRALKEVKFDEVVKEEQRFQWLQSVQDSILAFMSENKGEFKYMEEFMKRAPMETKKLILVEVYCLLAEKFNFNINEFYCEAFSVTFKSKLSKKVKKEN